MSKLPRKLLITDKNLNQLDKNGYLWSGYNNLKNHKTLLGLLEENADYYRKQLQNTIAHILEQTQKVINPKNQTKNHHLYCILWGSLFVEQSSFKSKAYLNILRLLVLRNEIEKKVDITLNYKDGNHRVIQSLKILSKKLKIDFKKDFSGIFLKNKGLKNFFKIFPIILKSQIFFLRYIIKIWPLRKITGPQWSSGQESIFIFSNLANLDKKKIASGEYYSNQWVSLPNYLNNKGYKLNWGHLYLTSSVIPNARTSIKWLNRLREDPLKQGVHAFLDQYLSYYMIWYVLKFWFFLVIFYIQKLNKNILDFEKSEYGWLWPIYIKDWKNSWIGPNAIQNIILAYQFDKMLSSLPKQELGLYLMENQNWERLFLFFWRKYGHGKIIGVAHTTIRYWDLRYFDTISKNVLPNLPQPDLVAVNGKNAWDTLTQTGYQMTRCVPVEALRYQYLRKFYPLNRREIPKDKKKLLVLGDISNLTTHQMMLQLESVYDKFKDKYTVQIKPHTANNIDLTKYPRLSASLEKQNLMDILLGSDVVLVSIYTSASLDALCAGLPVITFLDPNNFNFSPLRLNPNIRFVNNAEEIMLSLQDEQWITQEIFVKSDEYFWLDEEMPRWNKLIRRAIA